MPGELVDCNETLATSQTFKQKWHPLRLVNSFENSTDCEVKMCGTSGVYSDIYPADSLDDSIDGFKLCTAFKWWKFDSRRLQQLFGTPFSKVRKASSLWLDSSNFSIEKKKSNNFCNMPHTKFKNVDHKNVENFLKRWEFPMIEWNSYLCDCYENLKNDHSQKISIFLILFYLL